MRSINVCRTTIIALTVALAQGLAGEVDHSSKERTDAQRTPLSMFIGPWSLTETHFDSRGKIIATVKGTEEITWILDGNAVRRVYQSGEANPVYRAVGTLTWNEVEKRYHGVWFDNVSKSGPATAKGEWDDKTRTMVFTVESLARDGSVVRHRVVERFFDERRRVATTFLLKGDAFIKRMEVDYVRTTPCPPKVRMIFDDALGSTEDRN